MIVAMRSLPDAFPASLARPARRPPAAEILRRMIEGAATCVDGPDGTTIIAFAVAPDLFEALCLFDADGDGDLEDDECEAA